MCCIYDQFCALLIPEPVDLLSTAKIVLKKKLAQPPHPGFIEPRQRNATHQIAAELNIRDRNPELAVSLTADESLDAGMKLYSIDIVGGSKIQCEKNWKTFLILSSQDEMIALLANDYGANARAIALENRMQKFRTGAFFNDAVNVGTYPVRIVIIAVHYTIANPLTIEGIEHLFQNLARLRGFWFLHERSRWLAAFNGWFGLHLR